MEIIRRKILPEPSLRTSFNVGIERRHFIARNNIRLNASISFMLLIIQLFPFFLPWFADPNFEANPNMIIEEGSSNIRVYKKKSQMYLIISLFSVFANNQWISISEFIDNECPFVMKSGFECLSFDSF